MQFQDPVWSSRQLFHSYRFNLPAPVCASGFVVISAITVDLQVVCEFVAEVFKIRIVTMLQVVRLRFVPTNEWALNLNR